MNKSEIRKKILEIRKKKKFNKSKINFNNILSFIKKKKIKGRILGGYYPYNFEFNVMDILEKFENKNFLILLPKIKQKFQMDFYEWSTNDPLMVNRFGIPEPVSNKIRYPDILLVPLVAFDKDFNRIGYGGGFYDRYINDLKKRKKILTIGLAYSFQQVKKIPISKYDMKLDFIITNKHN